MAARCDATLTGFFFLFSNTDEWPHFSIQLCKRRARESRLGFVNSRNKHYTGGGRHPPNCCCVSTGHARGGYRHAGVCLWWISLLGFVPKAAVQAASQSGDCVTPMAPSQTRLSSANPTNAIGFLAMAQSRCWLHPKNPNRIVGLSGAFVAFGWPAWASRVCMPTWVPSCHPRGLF
ncbi:hypothetical protein B0T25DRAFT_232572 [Lasiosphaeria hispida]|uniref:Uncharacterized protein n=1 Tax=Lasiosphaeria hispida TaxID=260671 RepID=A0AAJ0HDS6_9PEZI|nr:hypothetical protein B0T25DRAFT_232572 [Lasiosphaeria hispida]